LLTNPQMRAFLVANAYDRVKSHYDWKRISMEFEAVYRRVI
jgi:glycosyltransferase involved in cell wall biosynthesis